MNTKYKVGDKVRIVANTCDHEFKRGEIVTITKVQIDPFICYTVRNDDDFWFVDDDDIRLHE